MVYVISVGSPVYPASGLKMTSPVLGSYVQTPSPGTVTVYPSALTVAPATPTGTCRLTLTSVGDGVVPSPSTSLVRIERFASVPAVNPV